MNNIERELWATRVVNECLLAADGDVDAALSAAEYICATAPLPDEVEIEQDAEDENGDPPIPTDIDLDAYLAHDIHNRRAQGILNRSLQAARSLTAAARKDLAAALGRGASDSGEAILRFIDKYRLQLARLLTTTQLAALLEGVREVAARVPPLGTTPVEGLPVAEQERIAALPPRPPAAFTPPAPPAGSPEGIHFPTIDEAVKQLAEKNVLDRRQYNALDAAARAKAFTVAGVQAEETLAKIRDSLADNVREGADYEAWKQKILGSVDAGTFLSDAHQETVFRTNVQSALSDGQMSVLSHPLVRSGFPYVARDAIHDDRVREEHLALERLGIQGTNVYRVDDPVWQLFRVPWDYNDRCADTLMTVSQAAEAGIDEARQWLDTGVEPSPPAHVAMPDFRPPPGFRRAVASAPLSIRLSIQPMATFAFDPSEPRDELGQWTAADRHRKNVAEGSRDEYNRLSVLGEAGKHVYLDPIASGDEKEASRRLRENKPLPIPGNDPEVAKRIGPAWHIISRLWPEIAGQLKLARMATPNEMKRLASSTAALHTETGELVIPVNTSQVPPAILWHELVHLEQLHRGVLTKAPHYDNNGMTAHGHHMESEAHQRGNMQLTDLIGRLQKQSTILSIKEGDRLEEQTDTALLYGESEGYGSITQGSLDTAHEGGRAKNDIKVKGKPSKRTKIGKSKHRSLFRRLRVKKRWSPSVPLSAEPPVGRQSDRGERLRLIAEILVSLFGHKAVEVAERLRARKKDRGINATLAHDVTDEPRDKIGEWTRVGGDGNNREVTRNKIKHGTVSEKKQLSGGANGSYTITVGGVRGVWKPRSEEKPRLFKGIKGGTYYRREVCVSNLADAIGATNLVPTTVEREIDGDVGSVMEFLGNSKVATSLPSTNQYGTKDSLTTAAAFDYLIGVSDRSYNNWMVDGEGNISLIDNGLSLPTNGLQEFESFLFYKAVGNNHQIPETVKSWDKDKVQTVLQSHGIEKKAIDGVIQRLTTLQGMAGKTFKDLYTSTKPLSIDAAFGPGGIWSGPTPPSKTGWVQIADGPRGGKRWAKVGSTAAAAHAGGGPIPHTPGAVPGPAGPVPHVPAPPATPPPTPTPPPAPAAPQPVSLISTAGTPARAHALAMHLLSSGQTLSHADKLALAPHLPNLGRDQLKQLHAALGAGGVYGVKAQIVGKVQAALLGGAAPAPTPPPVPAPAPAPAPASVLHRGANVITGRPAAAAPVQHLPAPASMASTPPPAQKSAHYQPPPPDLSRGYSPYAGGSTNSPQSLPATIDHNTVGGFSNDASLLSSDFQSIPNWLGDQYLHTPSGYSVRMLWKSGSTPSPGQPGLYDIHVLDGSGKAVATYVQRYSTPRDAAYVKGRLIQTANWLEDELKTIAQNKSNNSHNAPLAQFTHDYMQAAGVKPGATPFELNDSDANRSKMDAYLKAEFPKLIGARQHAPHGGMDTVEHTMNIVHPANLRTAGLGQRDAEILRLGMVFHDVGKQHDPLDHEHPRKSATDAEPLLWQFGLSEREVSDTLAVIKWHDTYGDQSRAGPQGPANVAKIAYEYADDSLPPDKRRAEAHRINDLLMRAFQSDVSSIPGLTSKPIPGRPDLRPSGFLDVDALGPAFKAKVAKEIDAMHSAGTQPRALPLPKKPALVPAGTAPPNLVAPGRKWGELVQRVDNLPIGQPVPHNSTKTPPPEVYDEARQNPDLNYARAFNMGYDGPTGQVVSVYHGTNPTASAGIFSTGMRPGTVGDNVYGHGIYVSVNGAKNVPGSYVAGAIVQMEVHTGRTVHHDELTRTIIPQWRAANPALAKKLRYSSINAEYTAAALWAGYSTITMNYHGGQPALCILDPSRIRMKAAVDPKHKGLTLKTLQGTVKSPDLTTDEKNTPSHHHDYVKLKRGNVAQGYTGQARTK